MPPATQPPCLDLDEVDALLGHPELIPLPPSRPETPSLSSPPPPSVEPTGPVAKEEVVDVGAADEEAPTCRICFGSAVESPELGRLISPCVCKGSIRHVHVGCLSEWRQRSASKKAFYSCDQCGFKYRFARTRILGLATNKAALSVTSMFIFLSLTLGTGHVLQSLLDRAGGSKLGEVWMYSRGGFYGGTTAIDLVKESIVTFSGGDVEEMLEDVWLSLSHLLGFGSVLATEPVVESSWIKSILAYLTTSAPARPPPPSATWMAFRALKDRFLLGLGAVGSLGALGSFMGTSAMPFLSMANALRLPIPFVGRRTRAGTRQGAGVGTMLIIGVVFWGGVQLLRGLYASLRKSAEWVLLRAENAVLDVGDSLPANVDLAADEGDMLEGRRRWLGW